MARFEPFRMFSTLAVIKIITKNLVDSRHMYSDAMCWLLIHRIQDEDGVN